ncbi:MAG: hypothetical protein IPG07_10615 [Crocinitomicaceae bacterium]|nr:hypothetical protein [Crocinitomicaceae bacterium]
MLSHSSSDYYDYRDSLIIITTEDYSEYKSSNEILVEQKILNRLGQDSIVVIMTGHRDAPLASRPLTYDNLGRKEKIETISITLIEITDFVYYKKTDFRIVETTTTTDQNGVFQKKRVAEFYPGSNELKGRRSPILRIMLRNEILTKTKFPVV